MRSLKYAVVAVIAFVTTPVAWAESSPLSDSQTFLRACGQVTSSAIPSEKERWEQMSCIGFAAGIMGTHEVYQHAYGVRLVCLPDGITVGQTLRVMLKYFRQNPEKLHLHPTYLATRALREFYPCDIEGQ